MEMELHQNAPLGCIIIACRERLQLDDFAKRKENFKTGLSISNEPKSPHGLPVRQVNPFLCVLAFSMVWIINRAIFHYFNPFTVL